MTRLAITTFVATALLLPFPAAGSHRQAALGDDSAQRFQRAVNAYVDLHRRAERSLPPLQPTDDWEQISRALDARAAAIRAARPTATQGDLFDRQIADVLRGRIRAVLMQRGDGAGELEADEEVPAGTPRPVVNGRFPWARGAMMPPDILLALPPLPEELQYRLVDRDLVLIDMHADVVVDILPAALPHQRSDTWR